MICITVSVNYANILDIILPQNAKFFKRWYIVTHPDDQKTIDIIKKHNISTVKVLFFDFYKGATFNKGGGIKYAQSLIDDDETVLILDSDIFIPDEFSKVMETVNIEEDSLYSLERHDFYTYQNFVNNTHDNRYCMTFMGFFQLYKHRQSLHYNDSDNCRVCDANFTDHFSKKIMMDGCIIKHLGRDNVNHFGRTSHDDFLL
jgi:hypothetical protein